MGRCIYCSKQCASRSRARDKGKMPPKPRTFLNLICDGCGKKFTRKMTPLQLKEHEYKVNVYCENSCRIKYACGERNSNWKGGRKTDSHGYIWLYVPEHPHSRDRYVREHRLVMEKYLGRYLKENEVVHHKDGDKKNNNISNLELIICDIHKQLHRGGRIATVAEAVELIRMADKSMPGWDKNQTWSWPLLRKRIKKIKGG